MKQAHFLLKQFMYIETTHTNTFYLHDNNKVDTSDSQINKTYKMNWGYKNFKNEQIIEL